MSELRAKLKALLGPAWTVRLRCLSRGHKWPRWGNIRANAPFSRSFGFDRGRPIDRYYLHRFLERNKALIHGEALEIQCTTHIAQFGTDIRAAHSLDIVGSSQPTYVCDLAQLPAEIPRGRYDCFLLPNTAQHLRQLEESLRNAWELIKPGGAILASSACLMPLIPDAPEYARLTKAGWEELIPRIWPGASFEVEAHGNCLAVLASIMGLACEELRPEELDAHDHRYPVLITVRAIKPGSAPRESTEFRTRRKT